MSFQLQYYYPESPSCPTYSHSENVLKEFFLKSLGHAAAKCLGKAEKMQILIVIDNADRVEVSTNPSLLLWCVVLYEHVYMHFVHLLCTCCTCCKCIHTCCTCCKCVDTCCACLHTCVIYVVCAHTCRKCCTYSEISLICHCFIRQTF